MKPSANATSATRDDGRRRARQKRDRSAIDAWM
jgi:hypothetical protein